MRDASPQCLPAAARRASEDLLRRCATSAVGSLSNTTCTYSLGHSSVSGSTAGTGKRRGQWLPVRCLVIEGKNAAHALDASERGCMSPQRCPDKALQHAGVQFARSCAPGCLAGVAASQVGQPCRTDSCTCRCIQMRRTFQNFDSVQAAVLLVHRRLPRCLEAGLQQGGLMSCWDLASQCCTRRAHGATMTPKQRTCQRVDPTKQGVLCGCAVKHLADRALLQSAPRSPGAGAQPGPRAAAAPSPAPAAPWPPSPAPPWPPAHRRQVKAWQRMLQVPRPV